MADHTELTAVIINHRTPDLLRRAVGSFRAHYPGVHLLLVDNGSGGESPELLQELRRRSPAETAVLLNPRNVHHGPAMDQALRTVDSAFVLFLDSDCTVTRGGWLEQMLERITADPDHYLVGKMTYMDRRGFDIDNGPEAIPYIRPICMMVRRDLYLKLPPFRKHGAPCLENVREARRRGYRLLEFPVEEAVVHDGRGTAARYGYHLGLPGIVNHLLHRLGL